MRAKAIAVRGYFQHSAKTIAIFGYFGVAAINNAPPVDWCISAQTVVDWSLQAQAVSEWALQADILLYEWELQAQATHEWSLDCAPVYSWTLSAATREC